MGKNKKIVISEEKKRYEAISADVRSKKGSVDVAKALARITAATAVVAEAAPNDEFDVKAKDFVGIMLDGSNGNVVSTGNLEVSTADVTVEEPRVVAEDEDNAEEAELRSLWGDGDDDPTE